MKPTVYIFVVLLSSLLGCGKESLEIPKPDLSIDWQKHVFTDVRPVDETGYPPCSWFPKIDDPHDSNSYDFLGRRGVAIAEILFQPLHPHYAIYSRSTPIEGEYDPHFLEVILLNLKTGETINLGETTGSPSIGGDYVIFPFQYEFVIYQISTGVYQRMDGDIHEIAISPKGSRVHFLSNSNTGSYKKRASLIYRVEDWKLVYETIRDSISQSTWISDVELVYDRFAENKLRILNLSQGSQKVFAGPFESHFRVFTGLSHDQQWAYGYQTYAMNLTTGKDIVFHHEYDGEKCETRDYGSIYPTPDGQLLVSRYYYDKDDENKTVSIITEMRLFDADGTNERMVTLLLK